MPRDSVPGQPRPPERLKPRAAGSAPQAQGRWLGWLRAHQAQGRLDARFPSTKPLESITNPKQLDAPAARARIPSQSGWSCCLRVPRTKLLYWLINGLIACQGPHLQNSEECDPGREKSETNPSNHPPPLHRQDTSRNNLTGLKPAEDFFFLHSFFLPSFTIFMSSSCLLLSISMF